MRGSRAKERSPITLLSPWLALLSAVPLISFWALFRGYGNLEQRYRDLDALHGFVRKVGPSLDLAELAAPQMFRLGLAGQCGFDALK